METKTLQVNYKGKQYKIEEDLPEVGFYLYVYENGKCIRDFLQNDIATCKQVAFEEYEVPINDWQEK